MAIIICLNGVVVASPAAYTPGKEVAPLLSISISPKRVNDTSESFNHSVFGTKPI